MSPSMSREKMIDSRYARPAGLLNLLTNPGMETAGTANSSTLRTNLATSPRGVNASNALPAGWTWLAGTNEVSASSVVTGATDGPVLPDGTQITTYARQTITTPKTANSTGWRIQGLTAIPTTIAAGDIYTASAWLRSSVDTTFDALRIAALNGATSVGSTDFGTIVLKANVWKQVSVSIASASVVTGAGDNIQVWAYQLATRIQPASTVDITGLIVEKAPVPRTYFDGAMTLAPVLRTNWANNPNGTSTQPFSFSTGNATLTRTYITGAADGPIPGLTSYSRATLTSATNTSSGFYDYDSAPAYPTVGTTWIGSIYVRASVATRARLTTTVRTGGVQQGSANGTSAYVDLVPGVWTRLIGVPFTADANGTDIGWWANIPDVLPSGAVIDATGLLIEQASAVGTYFDGASTAIASEKYAWSGTVNASPSVASDPEFTAAWSGTAHASASWLRGTPPAAASGSSAVALRSAAWAARGSNSLRIVNSAPSNGSATTVTFAYVGGTLTTGMNANMVAGKTYTLFGTARLAAPLTGSQSTLARSLVVAWNDVSGPSGARLIGSPQAPNVAGSQEVRMTFTIPANAVWAQIRVYNGATIGGGDIWWDNLALVEGDYTGPYFDGSMRNAGWQGTAHASVSASNGWAGRT